MNAGDGQGDEDARPTPSQILPRSTDPSRLIASLARDQVNLELKTVDLCFLAGLYLRADKAALASFEEDALIDLFEQVCDVVEPGAENPRKRATHAIQRLREQRMLARVDGAGIVRTGEYALTRLAAAVVEYFLADEALTRESLTLLTGTLRAQLAEILAAARKAAGEEAWRTQVVGPLHVTVADLVSGIERRQRGLDAQQEEVRAEISRLLSADWFSALDRCQALLDQTTRTLQELNEILLRDTHHLVALLQDIQALATAVPDAEAAAQRVIEHVDRIAAWGSARQRTWSEYYQDAHRFLRDVVRLDPDRALSQRLRDQLAGWTARPFHLAIARAPTIRLLRPLEARVDRPAVARPRADRDADPAWVLPTGDRLGRRHLSAGEMLVGQTLALLHLDPATLQHGGVVPREALLERLSGLVATEALVRTLSPRKRRYDERIAAETVRAQVAEALRRLTELGFVDLLEEGRLRLRPALMRFAEPVRGLGEPGAALEKLVAEGEVLLGEEPGEASEDDEPAEVEPASEEPGP